MKILAFGELLCDMTGKANYTYEMHAGGAPANAAVAAKRAGAAEVGIVTKVGADFFGSYLLDLMEKEGIDTENAFVSRKINTTLAFVTLTEGEREFSFYRLADKEITEEEAEKVSYPENGIFHFGSLSLTGEPILRAALKAVALAKKQGAIVSFDVNYRANLWSDPMVAKKKILSVLPLVDLVKVSEEEATFLTGISDPFDAAYGVMALGAKNVVLTMGKEGSLFVNDTVSAAVHGIKAEVCDTTGAGDCFYGTFLAGVAARGGLSGITEEEVSALLFRSNVAGAMSTEHFGAIDSYPTAAEVTARERAEKEKSDGK